ncbi:phage gp6-like head-tail connector protein [Acetobacter persici]|uniref:phage gp6-like head-tail connector protein n=1 Tax=Acetobacter persici TaxID=1076596 RepID=UPI001BA99B27|nr:phage gp6-like head-tail connector protein [Acetobacter persici]MBS1015404.1 phage gp6-like head-tail connector protein [Acetobacter persici]
MLYKLTTNDVTRYPGDIADVQDWVASLSPDQMPIIQGLADAATVITEKYLGTPIGKRSIRLVISRAETELNDNFARAWLQSGTSWGSCFYGSNQWTEIPTPAECIQSVSVSTWSNCSLIPLINGIDYTTDLLTKNPRIMFSYNMSITDYFYKFKNLVIDYVGGLYEVDGSVPSPILTAIHYLIKGMFENRGDTSFDIMDNGYKYLLSAYKQPDISGAR